MPTIQVDHNKLSDSLFSTDKADVFVFNDPQLQNLTNELLYGKETCFLISGYRGAGKSSFIQKVQLDIKSKITAGSITQNFLFVNSNLSSYSTKAFLFRKLIRDLYHSLESSENVAVKNLITTSDEITSNSFKIHKTLGELYRQTIYHISQINKNTNSHISKTSKGLDYKKLITSILKVISMIIIVGLLSLNNYFNVVPIDQTIQVILFILSIILTLSGAFGLTSLIIDENSEINELKEEKLYDEEIVDYRFDQILQEIKSRKIKIIFVFDEIDKLDEKQCDKMLEDLKPYLLSGNASFLLIAGQELTYRYYFSKAEDDAILSSLFSRTFHVSLLTQESFKAILKAIMVKQDDKNQIDNFNNYLNLLIFRSKRIPRNFINQIRQHISWDENNIAYLEIGDDMNQLQKYTEAIDSINSIIENDIENINDMEDAMKDYLIMQLFLGSSKILSLSLNEEIKLSDVWEKG
jgi:hypothetical protein